MHFPHCDGISDQSPRYIITGHTLNFQRHTRLELGAYVQMHEEHDNSMGPRTLGAICLGPTGNQQGVTEFQPKRALSNPNPNG